jgi:hypothetical protein
MGKRMVEMLGVRGQQPPEAACRSRRETPHGPTTPDDHHIRQPGSLRPVARRLPPSARAPKTPLGECADTDSFRCGRGNLCLEELLRRHGFDRAQHEHLREELKRGRIGLAQNRLPAGTVVADVRDGEVTDAGRGPDERHARRDREALAAGAVAVVTLAAGAGSRWTQGAGAVKALHPFCTLGGRLRTFLEIHLAKSRKAGREYGAPPPHVITTGYLTHGPIAAHLAACGNYGYPGPVRLSPGRSVGLRLVPTERDLRLAWEQAPQPPDGQAQRARAARITWVRQAGEGSDYTDNVPLQCLHPVGHWHEVPNLLLNGTLAGLLAERPGLRHLLVHNVDTLGATVDPALLGLHIASGRGLNFEVIPRRPEDQGGGLARVDGRLRLVEGLALPRARDQSALSFYNTLTTWVDTTACSPPSASGAATSATLRGWRPRCSGWPRGRPLISS